MKNFVIYLIIAVMVLAFSGCNTEELPQENIGELGPVISDTGKLPEDDKEKFELYEEMLLNFGALKTDSGEITANKIVSLYFNTDGFVDGRNLDETSCFVWAMHYLNYRCEYDPSELFAHPEFTGWAYPSEYYEPAVFEYFGIPAEELRKGELYNQEYDLYNIGGGGGIGDTPFIIFNGVDEKEDTVDLHLTLDFDLNEDCNMVLKVKLLPEGGYNYISYLPEETKGEEKPEVAPGTKVGFRIGYDGERKMMSVGDTIGIWTLEKLEAYPDEEKGEGFYNSVSAAFSGEVRLKGYISLNPYAGAGYQFTINDSGDIDKMPWLVSNNLGNVQQVFLIGYPEVENMPELKDSEYFHCYLTIDSYTVNRAYTESFDTAEVVKIEIPKKDTGLPELYEDIIINFGARITEYGELSVDKGISFYYNRNGTTFIKEDAERFYSYIMANTPIDDRIKVSFPGYTEEMFALNAEYYEAEVYKYFGISTEQLRKSDCYYSEQNCYFVDYGGGIGETPKLVINSIEENGDNVVFHVTIDYSATEDDYNMSLTVKLLPEGGYNYISYLPE